MRRYLIFGSCGLGLLMYSIDGTAVAVALPSFITELHTNVLWAAWTMTVFFIGAAMAMPLAGHLSDLFGRRKVFLACLLLFTGSSAICRLVPNIYLLILFRFIQGIGGASFLPVASGIVSDYFPESRERVIGLFTSIFPIGGIIGPNLGGWVVSEFSWRFIFYINMPVGIVLFLLIAALLEPKGSVAKPRIDIGGAAFLSSALFCFMLGLNIFGESARSISYVSASLLLLCSIWLFSVFYRLEKRESEPIVDVSLLRSKPFLAANLYNLMLGACVMGLFSFVPLLAVSVYKMSTLASGMILTPRSLGVIPAAAITSFVLKKWGYRRPMIIGMTFISVSAFFMAPDVFWRVLTSALGTLATVSGLMFITGIGMGMAFPASNNAAIELMPQRVSTIVGLRGMFRTVGAALGTSIATLILHRTQSSVMGFKIVFILFSIVLLSAIPLVFMMPSGKKENDAQKRATSIVD